MSTVTGFRISPQQAATWQQCQYPEFQPGVTCLSMAVEAKNFMPVGAKNFSPLHEQTLRERLTELTAREEILRTRLHSLPGMALPFQVIEDAADIALESLDWRDFSEAEQATQLQAFSERPMGDSILQVLLVQTADSRWLLQLKASACHLDVTSLWLLAQALRSEMICGETIAEDRLQYADYAEWKQSLLEEAPDHPGLQFWRQQHEPMSAPLLPGLETPFTEAPCAEAVAPRQKRHIRFTQLDTGITFPDVQLRATASGVAPEEYLFAAWCVLVGRLRGQTQLQLAWIDEGRGEGLENALGLYEQALPVQAVFDAHLPLNAQLEDLLKPLRSARDWQDYYDSSQSCDCYFAYRRFPADNNTGNPRDAFSINRRFCLGLDCIEVAGNRLQCRLAYDSCRFNATAIACLAEQWRLLLQGLEMPSIAVGAIPLQGAYQKQLLAPSTPEPVIEPVSLPELIERQVRANPNAPALSDNSGMLSYRELSARSNQLARYLLESGVQPGDVVGILLPRGNPMIIAILAVLKAGGAYLPLDPGYPDDRLADLVRDSGVRLVLTSQAHHKPLPEGPQRLLLDDSDTHWASLSDDSLAPITDLQQPAYLIYTSGSTGKPKAVPITHANLSHSTQVRMVFYDEPVKAYLLLSSFAFDSSVAGIFWTLAQGGLLVLPANGEELNLATLAHLIKRHRISHSLSLPSLYETLLDYGDCETFSSLTTWIVAGESCSSQMLAKHRTKAPHARLVNEYGPTEATVWATADVLCNPSETNPSETNATNSTISDSDADISIGRPIPTMQLWLLNEQGLPAAIGEPGEIHLGGPTLSPGYLGRPEQTAQAFVSSPAIASGARRYKTGDLARWRFDGRLSFLGRADHQVKIRGYRVEPGEIERQLLSHGEVREAAVIVQDRANGKRLVAYVTDRHGYPPEAQALSDYLNARLPAYMVPGAFVHLKALPRTPNGKLDLKALPDPDDRGSAPSEFVAPRNEMETELAAICAEVLRRERVGVLDDFFQIGGDSILGLQIVARAHQRGIHLSAKQVFESETVARMAEVATRLEHFEQEIKQQKAGMPEPVSDSSLDLSLAGLDAEGFQALLTELDT